MKGAEVVVGLLSGSESAVQRIMWVILFFLLLLLGYTDLKRRVLPDPVLGAVLLNRLIFLWLTHSLRAQLPGLLAGALCVTVPLLLLVLAMDRLLGKKTLGGGDLKLLFVLGLYFDWERMLWILFAACVFGLAGALLFRAGAGRKKAGRTDSFPFGPCIAAAAVVMWLLSCCGMEARL